MRLQKKKNEKSLKRARKRAMYFRALTAVHLLADRSCDICKNNSKNEVIDQKYYTWSSSYPERENFCKRFQDQKFKTDKICHMFEPQREISDE